MIGNSFFTSVTEFDEEVRLWALHIRMQRGVAAFARSLARKLYRPTEPTSKVELAGMSYFLNESKKNLYRSDYAITYQK